MVGYRYHYVNLHSVRLHRLSPLSKIYSTTYVIAYNFNFRKFTGFSRTQTEDDCCELASVLCDDAVLFILRIQGDILPDETKFLQSRHCANRAEVQLPYEAADIIIIITIITHAVGVI